MTATKYRKKPVVIEAMHFDGSEQKARAICDWANGFDLQDEPWVDYVSQGDEPYDLLCHTLEGPLSVSKGDWVIRGIKGEFYPCKPDIFILTYDHIENSTVSVGVPEEP